MNDEQLLEQMQHLVDVQLFGEAGAEDTMRLERLVLEHPGAKELYCRAIEQAVLLREANLVVEPVLADSSLSSLLDQTLSDSVATSVPLASPAAGTATAGRTAYERVFGSAGWLDIAPVLLIGALLTVLGVQVGFRLGRQSAEPPRQVSHQAPAGVRLPATAPSRNAGGGMASTTTVAESLPIATLVAADDAHWLEPLDLKIGALLGPGVLRLAEGRALVELDNGVRLALTGPSEFKLVSNSDAHLERGQVIAHVPSGAIGYTVTTPLARVIDRGTEFGVQVEPTGGTQVQVLAGAVDLLASARITTDVVSERVVAGQARELPVGQRQWREIAYQPDRFVWPAVEPALPSDLPLVEAPYERALGDDFNRPWLDLARWRTAPGQSSRSRVVNETGRIKLVGGGKLMTAAPFQPANKGLLRVRGRWIFASPKDNLEIWTRSAGDAGDDNDSTHFVASMRSGSLAILGRGKVQMRCEIRPGDVFDFELLDNGKAVMLSLAEVGGDATRASVVRQVETPTRGGHIIFSNRALQIDETELTTAYLEYVSIELGEAK